MNIAYKPLFTIDLSHSYYTSSPGKDFILVPSPQTQKRLKRNRMLFRSMPYGSVVLYRTESDGTTPFVTLPEKMKFTFTLFAENPKTFFNRTKAEKENGSVAPSAYLESAKSRLPTLLYFRNSGTTGDISLEHLDGITPPLFSFFFEAKNPPVSSTLITVADEEGNPVSFVRDVQSGELLETLTIEPLDDAKSRFEQEIDLRHLAEGKYHISVDGNLLATRYVSSELASKKMIAVVDIIIDEPGTSVNNQKFNLQFETRSTIWKYLIAYKNRKEEFTGQAPEVALSASAVDVPVYGKPDFNQAVKVTDSKRLIQGLETWVVTSKEPIAFYESPLLELELKGGGKKLMNHLPNASSTATLKGGGEPYESEIIVFV